MRSPPPNGTAERGSRLEAPTSQPGAVLTRDFNFVRELELPTNIHVGGAGYVQRYPGSQDA